jgi:indole-3-glycerol phosphate synthase/phosphoribosylanthranilate isomerase
MLNDQSLQDTILGKIVDDKLVWVEERKQQQPLIRFKDQLVDSDRHFYQALDQDKTVFILECKKASPSKGLIREDFDLDLIAGVYKNYASAISVLTDEKYFQGDFDYINKVRAQVTQPIICKDFIVDPYQIYLARYYQADAILLMLSVLDDDAYQAYRDTAHSLNMGVLTEVSNEHELVRAIALGAKVIGINNRDLRDLSIDLNRTKELAIKIPKDCIVISESGIYKHHQVKELSQFANGFLVGSSIMSQPNIDRACRELILGENKVCGLTHARDAADAYKAGAVYGGLIFVEQSSRFVALEQARLVMSGAPLKYVGVFQNEEIELVAYTAKSLGLRAVQLHGNETPKYVKDLLAVLPKQCEVWKAHGISDSLPDFEKYNVSKHVLDTRVGDKSGGTGQSFDWSLLNEARQAVDKSTILLAGGLNPDNAQQAALVGCAGLDFNSGVESEPGKKDADKLNRSFAAIRQYMTR